MEDSRIWAFEESLWTEGRENYESKIDVECLMVLPQPPYVHTGRQAIASTGQHTRANQRLSVTGVSCNVAILLRHAPPSIASETCGKRLPAEDRTKACSAEPKRGRW